MSDRGPLVLIVDDDQQLRRLLTLGIQKQGLEVLEASSADEALEMLRSNRRYPDVIVSDIVMPGTDGLQFCRQLRSDAKVAHIPILLLSCRRMVKDRVAGLDAGADDYMVKPFHLSELMARIQALHRRSVRSPAAEPVEATEPGTGVLEARSKPSAESRQTAVARGKPAADADPSFDTAQKHFRAGRFAEAFSIWKELSEKEPGNTETKKWLGIARQNLMRRYDEAFGGMDAVLTPTFQDPNRLQGMGLNPKEGFLLSRTDGRTTVRDLCLTSGLGKMETLRVLYDLLQKELLRLGGVRTGQPGR